MGREVGVNPRVEGGINMNQNTLYKILKYYLKKNKKLGLAQDTLTSTFTWLHLLKVPPQDSHVLSMDFNT